MSKDSDLRFHQLMESYLFRELTYDSDALNAFKGILKAFKSSHRPVYSAWGVPMFTPETHIFDSLIESLQIGVFLAQSFVQGLTFELSGHWMRRANFPSWSWLGWKVTKGSSKNSFIGNEYYKRRMGTLRNSNLAVFLQKVDNDILEWHEVFLMLEDGSFDEKTVSQTVTLDCWALEIKLEKAPVHRRYWVTFDGVELGAVDLDDGHAALVAEEKKLCGVVFGDYVSPGQKGGRNGYTGSGKHGNSSGKWSCHFIMVVLEVNTGVWERIAGFSPWWGESFNAIRCSQQSHCANSPYCEHSALRSKIIRLG
jgi:hypothetical protein